MKSLIAMFALVSFGTLPVSGSDFDYYLNGNAADAKPAKTEAALLLMGGGGLIDEAYRWFIEKAGGGDIVVLTASAGDKYGDYLRNTVGGCDSVETIAFLNRDAASNPKVLEAIRNADGIFIGGGAQWRYTDYWKGTPVGQALDQHVREGRPLGGSSAGLAVLGEVCYTAHVSARLNSEMSMKDPFDPRLTFEDNFLHLELMRGVITDTHFSPRNRLGRLITFLGRVGLTKDKEQRVGLGVDEKTALCVEADGSGRVVTTAPEGRVWLVRPTKKPELLASGKPLTFRNVQVVGIGPESKFHLLQRLVEKPALVQTASVVEGVLTVVEENE